ncbi:Response regulator receiver protein [Candidatus Sulfopaludibacter sp. SbA3]|nr:Response regulator receiver protein [Candidatus Sulfopaludibacter sp. SbA3]
MPRVLVVDDEEQIRSMLQKILTRAGHDVCTASNAQAAIDICERPARFDLVISDVIMPGVDGHHLARWLAVRCPDSRVILMSAFDPGCDECPYLDNCQRLTKPFSAKDVVRLVSDALSRPARALRVD